MTPSDRRRWCPDCGQQLVWRKDRMCQMCAHRKWVQRAGVPADDPIWHTPQHERRVAQLEQTRKEC